MGYAFAGRTVIVTGAASGIGAALARELATRRCSLALVDRDVAGLERLARTVGTTSVSLHPLDVADRAAVSALPASVRRAHGRIDVLVNNAGIAAMGRLDQTSLEEFDAVMAVNFGAVVALTKATLPHLGRDGRIANLSSLFGIVAPPGQIPYAASKFAVRGFTEALRHELAATGIKVTCVHPGGVRTAIAANARIADGIDAQAASAAQAAFSHLLRLSPERAATRIAAAIAAGKPRLLIGADAWLGDWLARTFPASYGRVLAMLMGRMRDHVGVMPIGSPALAGERR